MEKTVPPRQETPPSALPAIGLTGFACLLLCFFFGYSDRSDLSLKIGLAIVFLFAIGALIWYQFSRGAKRSKADNAVVLSVSGATCVCLLICRAIEQPALFLTVSGLLAVGLIALYLAMTDRMTYDKAITLILIAGFFVRLGYILTTDVAAEAVRQHDVYPLGNSSGHGAYIEYFYNFWQLPNFDPRSVWQFYHPPLHHFLAAVWLKAQTLVGVSYRLAFEGLQFLTLFYASLAILLSKRILEELRLRGKSLFFAMLIVTFSPAFILFSGSINNDILSIVFLLASVISSLKWYRTHALSHLLQTAIFIGLGMMTKTSVAMVAFPIAALMLLQLLKTRQKGKCIEQYAVFAAVVFPLGLWWPIRNFLRFKMPLNYVAKLSDTSNQYVGFHSFAERFIPFIGLGNRPTFSWNGTFEYNAWSGLFKSSAFGEYSMMNYSNAAAKFESVLFFFTMAVCIIAFAAMVYILIADYAEHTVGKLFMLALYGTTLLSYLMFCQSFPHSCTMNIRYASPLILVGAFFIGAAIKRQEETCCPGEKKARFMEVGGYIAKISCFGFAFFSTLLYTLLAIPR